MRDSNRLSAAGIYSAICAYAKFRFFTFYVEIVARLYEFRLICCHKNPFLQKGPYSTTLLEIRFKKFNIKSCHNLWSRWDVHIQSMHLCAHPHAGIGLCYVRIHIDIIH